MSTTKRERLRDAEKKAVTFKVVHQSYEDKDYDEANPKTHLIPEKQAEHRYVRNTRRGPGAEKPFFMFGEDMPDYSNKRNMHMHDDKGEGEETLFDGNEDETEFDEAFLQDLMYGDAGADDEEDEEYYDELDDGEYPTHDVTQRAVDKQFSKMMREFDIDAHINDADHDDPRAHGPLEVQQYMSTLEEFAEENAMYNVETAEPVKGKGFINQLKFLAQRNRIFDSNGEGMFVTTLLPDKTSRFMAEFKKETEAIQRQAAEALERRRRERHAEDDEEAEAAESATAAEAEGATETEEATSRRVQIHRDPALASDSEGEDDEVEDARDKLDKKYTVVQLKPKERYDCETILTTYSTLYNHPNVIAAAKKKINPNQALAAERRRQQEEFLKRQRGGHGGNEEEEDDEDEDDDAPPLRVADGSSLPFDVTQRPKDESAEEKKLRRSLIKEMQREKRQQKKSLKTAYKEAAINQGIQAPKSKQERAQLPLSLVRGGK